MAALVAGVQYGLSSHSNFPENKSLIFVKLTDSAQRAIEDYLRNGNTTNQNPTIQFLGNEGQLSFPSTQSSHGSAGFTFSLSGNQDIEGPQGGFECIQQTGPKSLESLGTLPWKMRIQANDDVYETTRHRMAVAEENNKNKCTRVIKANGPDIGRKVKVKATGKALQPIANTRHRELTSIPTSSNQSSSSSSSSSSSRQLASSVQSTVSSTTLSSSSSSSYKLNKSNNPPTARQHEKKNSDIMRRPLRERLIHLLALRPYKRPELYDRINKEGIKERDRSTTTVLLKQIACMKDNTYHLYRHVWNDVQEDWPFYTEQEKAMLKRRKPQNLTPPGSSDGGSSGSGQSPNSTHPGSPPAITAPPPSLMCHKRPGYYQSADGLQTKRPRISHFRKSEPPSGSGSGAGSNSRENARTTGGSVNSLAGGLSASVSGSGIVNGSAGSETSSWEPRQQQQQQQQQPQGSQHQQQQQSIHQQPQQQYRDRPDYRTERTTNSEVLRNYGSGKSCLTPTSDSEDNNHLGNASGSGVSSNVNNLGGNHHNSLSSHNHSTSSSNNHHHHSANVNSSAKSSINGESGYGRVDYARSSSANVVAIGERRDREERSSSRAAGIDRERDRERERDRAREREPAADSLTAGSKSYNEIPSHGASRYSGNSAATNNLPTSNSTTLNYSPTSPTISSTSKSVEYPDYLTYYTTISSTEQRRRYKDEFNSDYEEYRRLHAHVTKVSKRFAQLEERRRRELDTGNREKIEEIELQIWQEYNETKSDPVHIETKKRFEYLHEKLSHLKRLVHEYDMKNATGNGGTEKVGVRNGVVDVQNSGSLRY